MQKAAARGTIALAIIAIWFSAVGSSIFAQGAGEGGAGRRPRMAIPQQLLGAGSGLGAAVRDVTESDVKADKLPSLAGAFVSRVTTGGPAEKAGIRAGDVVVEFDGETVRSAAALTRLVNETPAGKSVKVTAVRDGKRLDVTLTLPAAMTFDYEVPGWPPLGDRQFDFNVRPPLYFYPNPPQTPRDTPRFAPPWRREGAQMGIGLQDLTPQLREYFGVKQGVLVSSVTGDSAAARAGVKAGDIVITVDGRTVRTTADVREVIAGKQAGDVVTLGIMRDKRALTIKVTLLPPRYEVRPL